MTLLHVQSYIPRVLSSGFAVARPAYLRKVKLISDFWIQKSQRPRTVQQALEAHITVHRQQQATATSTVYWPRGVGGSAVAPGCMTGRPIDGRPGGGWLVCTTQKAERQALSHDQKIRQCTLHERHAMRALGWYLG